jgi:hypothetical protein
VRVHQSGPHFSQSHSILHPSKYVPETMGFRLLPLLLSIAVPYFVDALPRGSSERREERELQTRLTGYGQMGGAAGVSGNTGQMREPVFLPPPSLPKPLSDHTASEWKGLVYIAGGCDSPYVFDIHTANFACGSISDSFFSFDPSQSTDHFASLPNLPRPRYRHSSVILNDQIWLVGGRDVHGNLIDSVDVSCALFPIFCFEDADETKKLTFFLHEGFRYNYRRMDVTSASKCQSSVRSCKFFSR